jgi:uncharacterized membrane protein YqaE (UPF0057 family)
MPLFPFSNAWLVFLTRRPTPAKFPLACRYTGRFHRLFEETRMRLLIAIFLPWLAFFTIGRPLAGIICLILQLTILGWLPAAIWAVYALSQYKTDQKIAAVRQEREP